MSTVRLTVAQALVRFLAVQRSERDGVARRAIPAVWGILGHGNVCGLAPALAESRDALPFAVPRHEQAMVHTAIGFARASRRLATLACTASIGPGATNMVTGAATATTNRLPVLLLPADTFATRRSGRVLQQLRHPAYADWTVNDTLRPVSRFFDRITRPEQLLTALPEAMRVLLDPVETGAVTLALAQDVQGEAHDWPSELLEPRTWHVVRQPPAPGALGAAVELLRGARRPLAIAGGGVRHAEAEAALQALADAVGIPVAETSAGKGAVHGPLAVGGLGVNGTTAANRLAATADAVLCVGTRLSDFTTASRTLFQAADVRFAAINVDAADAHELRGRPVVADARVALEALAAGLAGHRTDAAYREEVAGLRERWRDAVAAATAPADGPMAQAEVLAELNAAVRPGDWVVAAAGSPPGDLLKVWEAPPGSFTHIEFAFSCMGHELPAALGIRLADRAAGEVFAVIGDGTYLMAPTELVTAAEQGLKVTVVLLVNGGYQSIHALQRSTLGQSFGTEFAHDPDLAANARTLGATAVDVRDRAGLRDALAAARERPGTTVIACHVDRRRGLPASGAWWDLGVPEVADDPALAARAAEHRDGRARQRFLG